LWRWWWWVPWGVARWASGGEGVVMRVFVRVSRR
jgi:hypothetical protein